MKTILQSSRGANRPTLSQLMRPDQFRMLTRGAGANFLLSVPHGAVNFAVLEFVRGKLTRAARTVPFLRDRLDAIGPALDFSSSAISTICCSVVSTPQMMITDNIMAGNYPNLAKAISGLYNDGGIIGFYRGWFPGLVGKIPSYVS
jgi:solute carrier family 25 S-adenosylmethionine transporter 26